MARARQFVLVGAVIGAIVACESAPSTPVAPSAVAQGAPAQMETQPEAESARAQWGSVAASRTMAADTSSGFPCALGPFGIAEKSHYVISDSGYESLVCSGIVSVPPPVGGALILSDFPCTLPSGVTTVRSRFVLAPSGHATLTCESE